MLSIIGLLVILTVVAALLSGRVLLSTAMTIIPIVGALLAGFSLSEIGGFFNDGFNMVIHVAIMFIFAILYFGVMQDVGLFNPLVNFIIKVAGGSVVAISMGTVIVAAIAHLDGSGAATFLITIPLLLPIYRKLKMSPYLLVLLIGASASIMNMIPWAGPVGRIASVIHTNPTSFWYPLIPIQIIGIIFLLGLSIILAIREKKRIQNGYNLKKNLFPQANQNTGSVATLDNDSLKNHQGKKIYFINLIITIALIVSLVLNVIPPEFSFMIALAIVLPLNFPKTADRVERIKAHASGALIMAIIIVSAGVFLGVLKSSNMLSSLSESIIYIFPSNVLSHIAGIVSFFGLPLELVLNTDAYYFGLLPLVSNVAANYGTSPEVTSYMMLVSNVAGTFISPFSPALWLAVGLAGIDMGKYIKYSILWIWLVSLFLLTCTMLFVL